jgi:uncharacterized protein
VTHNRIAAYALAIVLCPAILGGCAQAAQPPHARLGWKARDFFKDKGIIALCKAIEAKNLKEIDRLVKSGVNINAKGRGNMTPLLWAFPMGEETFKKMLELGADPNVKLTENYLLLRGKSVVFASVELVDGLIHYQCFHDVPMENYLELVLKHGGDPNATDTVGQTPLFWIGHRSPKVEEKMIRLLVAAGANINHRNAGGGTALLASADRADYAMCLLKCGADYRITDDRGSDAVLWLASTKRSRERYVREHPNDPSGESQLSAMKPVFDWLARKGVDWRAARTAIDAPETMANLKSLPTDHEHRPWLPQRPTLKKPDAKAKK